MRSGRRRVQIQIMLAASTASGARRSTHGGERKGKEKGFILKEKGNNRRGINRG